MGYDPAFLSQIKTALDAANIIRAKPDEEMKAPAAEEGDDLDAILAAERQRIQEGEEARARRGRAYSVISQFMPGLQGIEKRHRTKMLAGRCVCALAPEVSVMITSSHVQDVSRGQCFLASMRNCSIVSQQAT